MKKLTLLCLIIGAFVFASTIELTGQISILSSDFLPDHVVCGVSEELAVSLIPENDLTESFTLEINFPPGINYLENSLELEPILGVEIGTITPNTESVTVTFEVTDIWASGTVLNLSLFKVANCLSIDYVQSGGVFEDEIIVTYEGSTIEQNASPYGILFGAIDVDIFEAATSTELVISNGGLGPIEGFIAEVELPAFWDFSGVEFENGTPLPYEQEDNVISFGVDGLELNNGESLIVVLNYEFIPDDCLDSGFIEAVVSWGCGEQECGTDTDVSTFEFELDVFALEDGSFSHYLLQSNVSCGAIIHEFELNNLSEIKPVFDIGFNFSVEIVPGVYDEQDLYPIFSDFQIEGISYPFTLVEGGEVPNYYVDFSDNTTPLGNLVDLDNDGFYDDLLPNTNLIVHTFLETPCPIGQINQHGGFQLNGDANVVNECGDTISFYAFAPLFTDVFEEMSEIGTVDFWDDGTDHYVGFCFDLQHTGLPCEFSRWNLEITVPAGFHLSDTNPVVSGGGFTNVYEESTGNNNTIYITEIDKTEDCIGLLLTYVCGEGTSSNPNIKWEVSFQCQEECDCIWELGDKSFEVFTHAADGGACPGDPPPPPPPGSSLCLGTGLLTLSMNAERVNHGFTDYSLNQVTPKDSIQELDIAFLCDSILIESDAIMDGNGIVASPGLRIIHNDKFDGQVLEWLSGTVDFYDVETDTYLNCVLPNAALEYGQIDSFYYAEFDLTDVLNTCGMNELTEGDSVKFSSYFRVSLNDSLNIGRTIKDLHYFKSIYYQNDDVEGSCSLDQIGQRFYIHDVNVPYAVSNNFFGDICDGLEVFTHLKPQVESLDYFLNEVRPSIYVDSVIIDIPLGLEYQVGSSRCRYLPNPLNLVAINEPIIIETDAGGQRLLYINDGTWPVGEAINGTGPTLVFNMVGTACSVASSFISTFYFRENAYAHEACHVPVVKEKVTPLQLFEQQTNEISLTNSLLDFDIAKNTGEYNYTFTYCNESNNDFQNVFALSKSEGIELVETSQGNLLVLNDSVVLIELGGLNEDECIEVELKFLATSCEFMPTMLLDIGWQCAGYPIGWKSYNCDFLVEELESPLIFHQSEVQLDITGPETAVQLCDTVQYEILLNSAQDANLLNPTVLIELPNAGGLNLAGMPMIEYPLNTPLRPFNIALENGQINIDLAAVNAQNTDNNFVDLSQGLLGLGLGDLETRQAKIHLSFVTDCEFVAGSQFLVSVFGDKICGDPAIGSGTTQLVEPVNIEGVIADHQMLLSVESEPLLNCESNHGIEITLNNLGPDAVESGTSIVAFVPKGMHFDNLTAPEIDLSFIEENELSFSNQLKFILNENLALNNSITFTVNLGVDESEFCVESEQLNIQVQSLQTILTACVSTGEDCEIQVQTNANSFFQLPVEQAKAELNIENAVFNCGNGQDSELSFIIENTGNVELSSDWVIQIFEDENNNGPDTEDLLITESIYEAELSIGANELITLNFPELNNWQEENIYINVTSTDLCWNCADKIAFVEYYEFNGLQDLTGIIWLDENNNGIVDNNETLLNNLPITLKNLNDNSVQSNLTDESGTFLFENLPLGEWQLEASELVLPDFITAEENIVINLFLANCGETYEQNIPLSETCNIAAEPTPICNNVETYSVHLFAATGVPPFTFSGSLDTVVNTFDFDLISDPISVDDNYSLTITDAQGCSITEEGSFDCSALNLNLLSLSGEILDNGNQLFWKVNPNPNRKHLLLERSWENQPFVVLEHFNTEATYFDYFTNSGVLVYQLSEVLYSNQKNTLAHLTMERKTKELTLHTVIPNPIKSHFQVSLNNPELQNLTFEIIDINGRIIFSKIQKTNSGFQQKTIQLSDLTSGVYFLKITSANAQAVQRIVKL